MLRDLHQEMLWFWTQQSNFAHNGLMGVHTHRLTCHQLLQQIRFHVAFILTHFETAAVANHTMCPISVYVSYLTFIMFVQSLLKLNITHLVNRQKKHHLCNTLNILSSMVHSIHHQPILMVLQSLGAT